MTLPIDFEVGDTDHTGAHNTANTAVNAVAARVTALEASPGDHGALTGLADDDHSQYHNNTRGDVRYYTKTQVDALPVPVLTGANTDLSGAAIGKVLAVDVVSPLHFALTTASGGGGGITSEQAQDAVAAMITSGTNTGLTVTYDDDGDTLSLAAQVTPAVLANRALLLASYIGV